MDKNISTKSAGSHSGEQAHEEPGAFEALTQQKYI